MWGFVGFVKTGQIFWKLAGFVILDLKWIFLSPDLWSTIQTKSGFVIHDLILIHGFERQIHGYTIPWYDSRNLCFLPSWTCSYEEQKSEGNSLVEVTVFDSDGHDYSGDEHHVGLLQVFFAYCICSHYSWNCSAFIKNSKQSIQSFM